MAAENNKIGKFVASLVELFDRSVKPVGEDKVYNNDSDNLYPNRVELVERNSVTAFAASNKLKSFIVGKGFVNKEFNEMIVNPKKRMKGYQFLTRLANSLKTHRGAFVHVNYDIDGNVNYLDVLSFKKCRVAKEDAFGYSGRIFYKNWDESKKKIGSKSNNDAKWFYPFDKSEKSINDQRKRDLDIQKIKEPTPEDLVKYYRGQVLFLNLDDTEVYPYAWVHPAYNDADSEYRYSLYRNNGLRTGFLDKTIIIPNGLDEESRNEFDDAVRDWLGSENSGSVFVYTPESPLEDPSKAIATISLKGSYDSKRFENDETAIANNIRKAYLSIPKILIDPEDSFFGSSGEAFIQAIEYYNKETLFIREAIAYMMDLFYNGDFSIRELGSEDLQSEGGGNEQ